MKRNLTYWIKGDGPLSNQNLPLERCEVWAKSSLTASVLASDRKAATRKACDSVFANLDSRTWWMRDGIAELELEAEEVQQESFLKAALPLMVEDTHCV